jgi:hypothetical protein
MDEKVKTNVRSMAIKLSKAAKAKSGHSKDFRKEEKGSEISF